MKLSGLLFVLFNGCLSLAEGDQSGLAPYLNKQYVLTSSDDKFGEVMEALGLGIFRRNMAKIAEPVMQLTEKDGEYTYTSDSLFENIVTKFRMGEEVEVETADGRHVVSCFTEDKNKLTEVQKGDKTTTIVREFTPEEVKVTVTVDDIVSVRIYTLVT